MGSVSSVTSKAIGGITNFKPLQKCCNYFQKNPEKAIAYSTIASVVGKDGIGCYMYVNQSLHNEKIPEEKRKFVAALDLTNGLLMIGAQLACFFAMRKVNKSLFNKIFNKSFDNKQVLKTIATQTRQNQKKAGEIASRKVTINKELENIKKDCFGLFSFVTELAAATILAKRVIVPFIATPLAAKTKKWMEKKSQTNTTENKSDNKAENKTEKAAEEPAKIEQTFQAAQPTNLLERMKK